MSKVVNIRDARRVSVKPAPKRRRPVAKPKSPDHALPAGVVFELHSIYGEGAENFAYRHRVRLRKKGGLAENLYDYGENEYLVGDVCESIGANKWSKPAFGFMPTAHVVCIRQIVDDKIFETIAGGKS